ncbi:MAG: hypothetical protein U9P10_15690 [Thermodesulfobacteriota bacterium]|nr:hypothetical protein [Thermodesulfobacteriota bacterium]
MVKHKILIILFSAVFLIIGTTLVVTRRSTPSADISSASTFTVTPGPLRINIVESGTIKAREQIIIKNQVE